MSQSEYIMPMPSGIDTGDAVADCKELVARLHQQGVRAARLSYSDLHGKCRSKDLPLSALPAALSSGVGYCQVSLVEDLHGNPLLQDGFAADSEFPDMRAFPDLDTARVLPWESSTVWLLADLEDDGGLSPRSALKRACTSLARHGLDALVAPELEFYLLRGDGPDDARHGAGPGMAYTMGARSDPGGPFRRIHHQLYELEIGVTSAHHEFSPGQFEINLEHGAALGAADRAFMFKEATRELASLDGLSANFMAKPFTDAEGSGLHLHMSLQRDGANAGVDDGEQLSEVIMHFLAGVLAHAPALTAFGAPTTNSYRRLSPDAMVPLVADWGHDHRFTYVRVPAERGDGTRLELRGADASANPYLVIAAALHAGLDGIERGLKPPPPRSAGQEPDGLAIPRRIEDALDALVGDESLVTAIGPELVRTFVALKRDELERSRRAVTDWEWREYAFHA
jgi:glutamine synthetase